MGVMAVLMTAAMPVWKQMSQREKEAELVFRGEQYARAIGLFQRKAGPGTLPPNLDVLLQQRFLRAKYKDPITGQDFDLLSPVQPTTASGAPGAQPSTAAPSASGRGAPPASSSASGRGAPSTTSGTGSVVTAQTTPGRGGTPQGGIIGVASKSKERSIRLYNGRNHYNEWQFIYVQQVQAPAAGGPGSQPQRGQQPERGQGPTGFPGIGGRGGRGSDGTGPFRGGADGRGGMPRQPFSGGGIQPNPRD
jgi:type II secretory pathway pseudopilin PulG